MSSIRFFILVYLTLLSGGQSEAAPPITAVVFAPGGKLVVVGSQNGIEVRSWPELKLLNSIQTELEHVHDLAFSPDGKTLLAAGGSPAEEGTVEVISGWPETKQVRRITEHQDLVYRVAWSPDGTQWVTAGADGICQVFSQATGQRLVRYDGHSRAVLAVAYLPEGKNIISAGVDQTLRIWNSSNGQHIRTLDNHVNSVNDIAIRPTAYPDQSNDPPTAKAEQPRAAKQANETMVPTIIASASEDRTVRLWQPSIGRLLRFTRLPATPRVIAWSQKGDQLFVGCNDGHVRVIDPDTMAEIKDTPTLEGRIYVVTPASNESDALIAGESGMIRLGSKQ